VKIAKKTTQMMMKRFSLFGLVITIAVNGYAMSVTLK
jgi:hypothetical protein